MMANQEDLGDADDRRAGQAAGRGEGRDRLCAPRSSSGSPRRASASTATRSRRTSADKRIVVIKEPIGVVRRDHAVELPGRDDHPQGRAGAGRRLHDGAEAGDRDAVFGAGAVRTGRARRACRRACSSCVTGGATEIGGELTSNPIVRKLTFTGSTEVGKLLMEQCAGTVKKVSLELGGNAPFIVFDDADIEMAVKGAIASKYRNAGQTCVCANRILVQDGVYDAFAQAPRRDRRRDEGRPTASSRASVIGPLIDMKAVEKVEAAHRRRACRRAPRSWSAASATRWAAASSSRPC